MSRAGSNDVNKWHIFFVVAIGIFMSTLDGSIVNLALPTIMEDLKTPLATIEWVMMIYLLTVSSLLLSFGRLSDIKGRRWVYTRGLVIFALGSLFCGISKNAMMLICSRAFQGIGAAMIMSCTQAIVVDTFPTSEWGKALGMIGAVVASGLTSGPALGGWILHISSWQTIFYINIPIGLGVAFAANRLLKGGTSDIIRKESFDIPGAFFLALATGSMLFALTHGYDWGYLSPPIISLFGISFISIFCLVKNELKAKHPLVEPSLVRIRLFTMSALSGMIIFSGLFTIIFIMPFYLMHPCGLSPKQTGYMMITPFIFLFVFAPLSGAMSDKIGSRILCTLGMTILTVSFFFLSRLNPAMSLFSVAWRLAMAGIGIAIFTPPNNAAAMSSVPYKYMGVAAGTIATVRNLGMVLGIALAGTIFNYVFFKLSGGLSLKVYTADMESVFIEAFRCAMLSGAMVSAIGIAVSFLRGAEK